MTKGPSMSDFDGEVPGNSTAIAQEAAVREGPSGVTQTAGNLLRQAREAAGLHIAALAVALKVPVKKLEALEADRLDLLPDAVFVRALASSVCRTLKIDVAPVLALLPQTGTPRLGYQRASINTPFRSPSDGPGPSLWTQVSRPAVLTALLLVLGALVLIFLPAVQQQATSDEPASALAGSAPAAQTVTPAQVQDNPPAMSSESPPAAVAEAMTAAAPAIMPGVPTVPAPIAGTAVISALPAASAPAPVLPAGTIVFSAKGESWVEVTDAKGVVVLRRTLAAGEAASVSGVLPLAAVVGRADATQVQVRGRPFDLAAVSKDNVARFEVK